MSLITASHFYFQCVAILAPATLLGFPTSLWWQSSISIGSEHDRTSAHSYYEEMSMAFVCKLHTDFLLDYCTARKKSSTATFCT